MRFHYLLGATPLDPDEAEGLMPSHIMLQMELNEWEQKNILEAEDWAFGRKHGNLFSVEFLQKLHNKMFDQTWTWAGKFRKTNKNVGVDSQQIQLELRKFCDDVSYQFNHKGMTIDEMGARLHHRLVFIHPFPNGNGRHARLYTDIVLVNHGQVRFSWGEIDLRSQSERRKRYIEALRQADNHNFDPLLSFVRS
jgi:Fic-DOC domain mobile mystery protein B